MTPVSAIRGEYRIRKEKLKVRMKSIFGKLFGVEGDYAYKSIMRNPGRFHKTVWALGIGIAAFIAISGIGSSLNKIIRDEQERYKYYHVQHCQKGYSDYFRRCDNAACYARADNRKHVNQHAYYMVIAHKRYIRQR